jgi:hypothetical protein
MKPTVTTPVHNHRGAFDVPSRYFRGEIVLMNARRLILTLLATTLGTLACTSTPALATKEFVPAGSFGSEGAGNGQFKQPTGVAVNDSSEPLVEPAAGDVYVLDLEHSRVEQFSSEGAYISQFNGSETPEKELLEPRFIAVDNSGNLLDPAAGNVYVISSSHVDEFGTTGTYKGRLTGTCENIGESAVEPGACPGSKTKEVIRFGGLRGLATDPAGDLWVYAETSEEKGQVDEFSDTGSFLKAFNTEKRVEPGFAVDSTGNVYVVSGAQRVVKFEGGTGTELAEFGERASALAIDPATNDLLVDKLSEERSSVAFYKPSGELLETFPSEGLSQSEGIAMSSAGTVFVSQRHANNVEIFDYILLPVVSTGQASGVSETGATLHGTVNPNGEAVSECRFEYGTEASYGQSVQCAQTPAEIGNGAGAVAVSAELGLQPRTTYHFRLDAVNANGTRRGKDETLYTFGHPLVEGESAASVGSTEASVGAQLDASGLPTTYRVEYGTSEAYGSSTPEVNLGASQNAVGVLVQLSGLQSGTKYHFRFVATNPLGTLKGSDETLTTTAAAGPAALTLPDHRAYELVSSPSSNANVQPPLGELEAPGATATLVRAAAGGDAVVYEGDPPAEGGAGDTGGLQGNTYIATRGPHGWTQTVLQLFIGLRYQGFSSDLSVGVLNPEEFTAREQVAISSAVPAAPANCTNVPGGLANPDPLFTRTSRDGGYHALLSTTPTPAPTFCGGQFGGGNVGTAAVPQYSHILFHSRAALASGAIKLGGEQGFNLYDSVGGSPHLISILPDGTPDASANFAGANATEDSTAYSSANGSPYDISADGSRVFWTKEEFTVEHGVSEEYRPMALYVRENDTQPQSPFAKGECIVPGDACTVQLDLAQAGAEGESGHGLFRSASSDGSKAFFTDENRLTVGSTAAPGEPDLYEYEVNAETGRPGRLTDLTADEHAGEHANVQGVMGTSEDGSYVYFVADGVLSIGTNVEGREPVAGQPNLYLRHDGVTSFIAVAGSEDEESAPKRQVGNAVIDAGNRTAEATPDGHSLVFRSKMKLTGYENLGLPEVFVYDAGSGRLSCASCEPAGAPPTSNVAHARASDQRLYQDGADLTTSSNSDFMPRWVSEDGSRVFFVTGQPLVSQDVNHLQDVYEWERMGGTTSSGNSCTRSSSSFSEVNGGCVYLLSGGTSTDDSYFLDASANGDDVFLRTRAPLAPQAVSENMALYDVRVGGGFPETSLACTGTGCQGVPAAAPIFATPASVTFNGTGNFPSPPAPMKKTTKKTVKCPKGKKLSHGKCVRAKTKKKTKAKKAGDNRRAKR